MGSGRWWRVGPAILSMAIVVAPLVALTVGVVVDRGPDGAGRLTAFSLALAASDGSVREAARNSLMLASGVSLASLVLGGGLARCAAGRRFRGRGAWLALASAPGAVPPLFGAIGLLGWFGPERFGPGAWRWAALAGLELAWAVPRVMAAALGVLERVPPAWGDAARMAGASRRRAWWVASWPAARPEVGRALVLVFAATLVEPTAPLVLGVRRTLGFAIVDAAWGNRTERAAVLGALALGLIAMGRALILRRAGSRTVVLPATSPGRSRTSWASAVAAAIALSAWAVAGLLPLAALLATAAGLASPRPGDPPSLAATLREAGAPAMYARGAWLGLGATVAALALAATAGRVGARPSWRHPSSWPRFVPGLLFGLGGALIPRLLDAGAVAMAGTRPVAAAALRVLADGLDPYLSPWTLLVAAVALLRVPEVAAALASARVDGDGMRIDAARTLGASRWVAWRTVVGGRLVPLWAGVLARSFARSALDVGPALLLAPALDARPIGPGLLALLTGPEGAVRASVVAAVALLIPLLAWAVAGTRRGPG